MNGFRHLGLTLGLFVMLLSSLPVAAQTLFPPGATIGVTPPEGMTPSNQFQGFENSASGASIAIFELPAEAYARLGEGFAPTALREQGFGEVTREDVTIAGAEQAILVSGEQTAGPTTLRKWLLVAKRPQQTALIVGQMIKGKEAYPAEAMKQAVTSVAFREPLPLEEQIGLLPFTVADRAGFRPVRALGGNSLMMTDGANDVIQKAEQPLMILALSASGAPPEAQRDAFARAALGSLAGLSDLKVERVSTFRQQNADWHEIVAVGKEREGVPVAVIQSLRFMPGGFVRMVGITKAETRDDVMPRFRQVIDGVSPK